MWSGPTRGGETPAVYVLLAVIGIVFLLDFYTHDSLFVLLAWPIDPAWPATLHLWQALTFSFTHDSNFWYLITDAIVLYFFGGSLERAWGAGKFLFFFFASGLVAGLLSLALSPMLGSGLFYGMVGNLMALVVAFAAMNPFASVYLYFFPVQARWLGVLSVAFELFGRAGMYGSPIKALIVVPLTAGFAYWFTVGRISLRSRRSGPSFKEQFDRWQQRRRMKQWQRRVSRIDRPDDLFKNDK